MSAAAHGRTYVDSPTSLDILMGKGKDCFNHEGNRRFRALISACSQKYHSCKGRYGKRQVVSCLSRFLIQENSRFLKFDKSRKAWYEANTKDAKEKIGHAIRDNINFRIGITLRNMGKEQSKEVEYEVVQAILDRKPSDGTAEAFEADVAKLEVQLESCFESDDAPARNQRTKVQPCILNRIQKSGSGGSNNSGGGKRPARNRGRRNPNRTQNVARVPSPSSLNDSSTSDHSLFEETGLLKHSMSIESTSSTSNTPSPPLPSLKAPSSKSSLKHKNGKVKGGGKVRSSRAPLKKRHRRPSTSPPPQPSPVAALPPSTVSVSNGHADVPMLDGNIAIPQSPLPKISSSATVSSDGSPTKDMANEAIGILSTMRRASKCN